MTNEIFGKKINLITGNKIIAEFMGAKELKNGWISIEGRLYDYQKKYYPNQLKYHNDWGWLMPVIEKIEETNLVNIYSRRCEIMHNKDTCPVMIIERNEKK